MRLRIFLLFVTTLWSNSVYADTGADHWLYSVVPPSYEKAKGLSLITWAIFGNDEDGIFGERSSVPTYGKQSVRNFGRWWMRNPFHNLCAHVLRWQTSKAFVLVESPGKNHFHERTHRNWVTPGRQFQITLVPVFVSWRTDTWEGYLGWREDGALGIAMRRAANTRRLNQSSTTAR